MPVCSVFGCFNSNSYRNNTFMKYSLHKFPNCLKSPDLHRVWLTKINRVDFKPTKTSVVCSNHFRNEDYEPSPMLKIEYGLFRGKRPNPMLKKEAVPSLNLRGSKLATKKWRRRSESLILRKKRLSEAAAVLSTRNIAGMQEWVESELDNLEDGDDVDREREPNLSCVQTRDLPAVNTPDTDNTTKSDNISNGIKVNIKSEIMDESEIDIEEQNDFCYDMERTSTPENNNETKYFSSDIECDNEAATINNEVATINIKSEIINFKEENASNYYLEQSDKPENMNKTKSITPEDSPTRDVAIQCQLIGGDLKDAF